MSQSEIIAGVENEQTLPKPKYYTEKHREYVRKYREKHGSYSDAQKQAIYKYNKRIKEEAKLFQ